MTLRHNYYLHSITAQFPNSHRLIEFMAVDIECMTKSLRVMTSEFRKNTAAQTGSDQASNACGLVAV